MKLNKQDQWQGLLTHAEEAVLVSWIAAAYHMDHSFTPTWIKLLAGDIVKEQRGVEWEGQSQHQTFTAYNRYPMSLS